MNVFRNMKLAQKISILSLCLLVFLSIMGLASIKQISKENSKIKELNSVRMTPIIELGNIKSDIEYIRGAANSLMNSSDKSSASTVVDTINSRITTVEKALEKYKSDSTFKTLLEDYNSFITAKDAFITFASERGMPGEGNPPSQDTKNEEQENKGAPTAVSDFDKATNSVVSDFDEIINNHAAAANQSYKESASAYKETMIMLLTLLGLCVVMTLILSVIIIKSITIPINKVTQKLQEISQSSGDLTQRINYESKDEIGQLSGSFDSFIGKLQGIISEVAVSAEMIAESGEQLNNAAVLTTQSLEDTSNIIANIAEGTADEAATAQETTASLSEAARFSQATAIASKNTTNNSKRAKEAAEKGAVKISEVVSSITNIAASSKEVSLIINELEESSKKIGDIIKIITSISEQTNLLALNAAIEAARAGEAGKGFNVVAEEIRKLADESNNAAREISELVKENQFKSASAVNSVGEVEKKVSLGVTKATEVGESISNIIENVQHIVNEIEQIEDANEQQAQTTKEIEKAIGNIAATSNEIAGSTENMNEGIREQLSTMTEIKKSTQKLSESAGKLKKLTSGFRV